MRRNTVRVIQVSTTLSNSRVASFGDALISQMEVRSWKEHRSTLIQLTINGQAETVPGDLGSVEDLLRWLGVRSDRVAVELNKKLIRRRDWNQTSVASGSQVEIVEFVGGG